MRGDNEQQAGMYSYISPEQRVPADHPLRPIRKMTDEIFKQLSPQFDKLYSRVGRPSIAPERLLRALLLQVLYSVRSERMLMEQSSYNMLFRWFVGLNMDDAVWDATTFSKNRDRLLRGEIAEEFFAAVLVNQQATGSNTPGRQGCSRRDFLARTAVFAAGLAVVTSCASSDQFKETANTSNKGLESQSRPAWQLDFRTKWSH